MNDNHINEFKDKIITVINDLKSIKNPDTIKYLAKLILNQSKIRIGTISDHSKKQQLWNFIINQYDQLLNSITNEV